MANEGASLSTQEVSLPSTICCVQGGDEKDGVAQCSNVKSILYFTSSGCQPILTDYFSTALSFKGL
ncbi:uncharacterized protein DS421_9g284220 [Arachis hypogaea]|nr:uncharacterized protein DS421_9g284220 [Arachis hypogaea]